MLPTNFIFIVNKKVQQIDFIHDSFLFLLQDIGELFYLINHSWIIFIHQLHEKVLGLSFDPKLQKKEKKPD